MLSLANNIHDAFATLLTIIECTQLLFQVMSIIKQAYVLELCEKTNFINLASIQAK